MEDIEKEMAALEEETLRNALEQYLGRELTKDDVMRGRKAFRQGIHNKYDLYYDDCRLGNITKEVTDMKYSVTFTPYKLK